MTDSSNSGAENTGGLPRKEFLRREVRNRIRAVPPEERASRAERIEANVWTIPEMRSARVILLYASLPSEVPTDAIAEQAASNDIEVVYPRCLPEAVAMTLHVVDRGESLVHGGFLGMREPAPHCPLVHLSDIDVAILPGLAWDRAGRRLGRGGGYYDRLFADFPAVPLRVGLFFATQEAVTIPEDPWDVPLDVIVTESEVVRIVR
jgi:5-formyltetrahydrofolate cyclo-ligase